MLLPLAWYHPRARRRCSSTGVERKQKVAVVKKSTPHFGTHVCINSVEFLVHCAHLVRWRAWLVAHYSRNNFSSSSAEEVTKSRAEDIAYGERGMRERVRMWHFRAARCTQNNVLISNHPLLLIRVGGPGTSARCSVRSKEYNWRASHPGNLHAPPYGISLAARALALSLYMHCQQSNVDVNYRAWALCCYSMCIAADAHSNSSFAYHPLESLHI